MIQKLILALTLSLIAAPIPMIAQQSSSRVETSAGTIQIVNGTYDNFRRTPPTVELNGTLIFRDETEELAALEIKSVFKSLTPGEDIVILQGTNGGGSPGCPYTYIVIALKRAGTPFVSKPIGNCSEPTITRLGSKVTLRFPLFRYHTMPRSVQRAETWVYQSGRLNRIAAR